MRPLVRDSVPPSLPAFLTVEEAGALLRIGRTKAYAMAREWRDTEGQSGLPVIDLGHVLRVPRRALEEMVGAELTATTFDGPEDEESGGGKDQPTANPVTPVSKSQSKTQRRNRVRSQLDLFDSDTSHD